MKMIGCIVCGVRVKERYWSKSELEGKIPEELIYVKPVEIGEALRRSVSPKEPIQVKRTQQGYVVMYIEVKDWGVEAKRLALLSKSGLVWNELQSWVDRDNIKECSWYDMFRKRVEGLLGKYHSSQFVTNTIEYMYRECDAIRMRRYGTTYFVPYWAMDKLMEYERKVLNVLDGNLDCLEVYDTERSIRAVELNFYDDIQSRLSDIVWRLEHNKRASAYRTRQRELEKLEGIVNRYRQLGLSCIDNLVKDIESVWSAAELLLSL